MQLLQIAALNIYVLPFKKCKIRAAANIDMNKNANKIPATAIEWGRC
jgi:hypothetical protein